MRELLFSVTAKNVVWQFLRGSGKGGQKKNKTSSAVRCTHKESGATGYAEDTRSQAQNRRLAFKRMGQDKLFPAWVRIKAAEVSGETDRIKARVDESMKFTLVEVKDEDGRWVITKELGGCE